MEGWIYEREDATRPPQALQAVGCRLAAFDKVRARQVKPKKDCWIRERSKATRPLVRLAVPLPPPDSPFHFLCLMLGPGQHPLSTRCGQPKWK
jgi:hypothetical protein